jgi:hypothetical protein
MRIVVLGYIVRAPYGAICWHHFQYVLGFIKLGHEVLFIEDSDDYPGYHNYHSTETAKSHGLAFTNTLFERYGLKDKWTYQDSLSGEWYGVSKQKALDFCSKADIVFNLSGINPVREWWFKIPCRVYLDTDCAFTQIKFLQDKTLLELAQSHTSHFSLGENIGEPDCTVPHAGFDWKTTRQPVVLDVWKLASFTPSAKWTTIMHWDSYPALEYNGRSYGMKSQAFAEYLSLPKQMPDEQFELGVKCNDETAEKLKSNGWEIVDPLIPTKTPWTYQEYIANSKGEFSVAKHGFAVSKCGYLSERSLNYMASGKPVVIQDTGFSKVYPTGEGLFSFSSMEEVVEAITRVNYNYELQCRKAREIVEEYARSSLVLDNFLRAVK